MKKIITVLLLLVLLLTLSSYLNFGDPNTSETGSTLYTVDNSHYTGTFTYLSSATTWNDFFPERWGMGDYWNEYYPAQSFYTSDMKSDIYSYANFKQAVDELQTIKLKIEPVRYAAKKIYKKDTSKDSDWVYVCEGGHTQSYEIDAGDQIIEFSHFINKPNASEEDKLRELTAFLANISHEVGETINGEPEGLFYREEIYYEANPSASSYIQSDADYPAASGKSYHGRGPMQLSWNYNYGAVSLILFDDRNILLSDPDKVKTDGVIAFKTAIWFWMFPQYAKPSCHQVMYSDFEPNAGQRDAWGFGHTVVIINGGFESNGSMKERRFLFYQKFARLTGVRIGINGENVDTVGISSY